MASGTPGGTLRRLRDLFHDGSAVGLGDGTLLARYATDRDEAAFEALVARHGPMVLATCRAVLRDEHDVEDAFQATFLVLVKKARSVHAGEALGGWLHRVAYRAAVQASADARRRRRREAEASAMATLNATRTEPDLDIRSVLHEEVDRLPDRERLPVVLCDLEGLTHEQAAGRLHWTEPTLRHRLLKARRRLRERLIRRGVTAGAVGVVLEASAARAKTAVPAALVRSAVAAATGGAASMTATALSVTIIRSLSLTKLKIAAGGVLAAAMLVSMGFVASSAARLDDPKTAMKTPDAVKEKAAARPIRSGDPKVKPQAPTESRARIEGRIVDLEGRPVAGARIHVPRLWSPPPTGNAVSRWLERLRSAPGDSLRRWLDQARDKGVDDPTRDLNPWPVNLTTTTGTDGRFRLADVGPDQIAEVLVSGPTIATAELYVMGRDGDEVRVTSRLLRVPDQFVYRARRFEYAVAPGKPIQGVIRDKDTSRPLAGMNLKGMVYDEHSRVWAAGVEATSDEAGHYRLTGLPRAPAYRLFVEPGGGRPYLNATFRVAADTPAFDPVTYDFALKRGIVLRGKVTDKATGRPISGFVNVYTFEDNPHNDEFPGYRSSYPPHVLVQNGRYEVVALPGRGVIGFRCRQDGYREHYRGRVGAEAIKGYDPGAKVFRTEPTNCEVGTYHVVAELNLDSGSATATLDIQVDPGRTLVVNPVDPEGRPVAGTMAAGVDDLFPWSEHSQPSAKVEVHGLDPGQRRRVTITHAGRKLIGSIYLKGDETGPLTLRLQPYGTLTGRIIDDNGQPSGGLRLFNTEGVWPPRPAEQGILPAGDNDGIHTGPDGRFRVEGLVPGLRYGGSAAEGRGEVFRDVTVASGEVKDLGDLKPTLPKRDN